MSEYPEGRTPLTWQDMPFADKPKGHPSTFEAECKQLRAKLENAQSDANCHELRAIRAIREAKQLRARVAELEAALREIDRLGGLVVHDLVGRVDASKLGAVARLPEIARAALNPPQEPSEATTGPL